MADRETLNRIEQQIAQDDFSNAADVCLTLLRQDPRDVEVIYLYGKLAMEMGRREDAIVVFGKLLALVPAHKVAHECLAYLFQMTGDYRKACEHALSAIRIDDQSVEPHVILGEIALAEGRNEEALQKFEEARKLSSGDIAVEKAFMEASPNVGDF